jgi:hypothetical protein
MKTLVAGARRAGPYVLVELLLPGGSLVALAMLAWANRKRLTERFRSCNAIAVRLSSAFSTHAKP